MISKNLFLFLRELRQDENITSDSEIINDNNPMRTDSI